MNNAIGKQRDFIERSLTSALSFIRDATLSEEHAARKGFLQSMDPRTKTVGIFALLLTAISLKSIALIGVLYVVSVVLAVLSAIHPGYYLVRTWVFIPLFSLFIVIPALFSHVTPGEALFSLPVFGNRLVITRPGLHGAAIFVVRVATSVSLAVLLSLTTRHAELLKVARNFGVPQMFVLTVAMCYRYLYLFADIVESVFLAIRSRVGIVSDHKSGRQLVGWNIANTWNRTARMSEDVYRAMLSRGYTGEPRLFDAFRTSFTDWLWMFTAIAMCAGLFYLEYHGI